MVVGGMHGCGGWGMCGCRGDMRGCGGYAWLLGGVCDLGGVHGCILVAFGFNIKPYFCDEDTLRTKRCYMHKYWIDAFFCCFMENPVQLKKVLWK